MACSRDGVKTIARTKAGWRTGRRAAGPGGSQAAGEAKASSIAGGWRRGGSIPAPTRAARSPVAARALNPRARSRGAHARARCHSVPATSVAPGVCTLRNDR
eukprot:12689786-Alexandrium_andersonii.AAC.1